MKSVDAKALFLLKMAIGERLCRFNLTWSQGDGCCKLKQCRAGITKSCDLRKIILKRHMIAQAIADALLGIVLSAIQRLSFFPRLS
jgi:hypothetical protein